MCTKGDRVKVINAGLAVKVCAMVSNGDTGEVLHDHGDGFVEVLWDNKRYPNWDIQIEALARLSPKKALFEKYHHNEAREKLMPNTSNKTKPIAFRVEMDDFATIERRANRKGILVSEYVKRFISNDVRRKR